MRVRRIPALAIAALCVLPGCRGTAPAKPGAETVERLVDSLQAPVQRATGLAFKQRPRVALRTREQVRAYLVRKLDEQLPAPKLRGLETTYRLFGLLPDTLKLRSLLEESARNHPDAEVSAGVGDSDR